MLLRVLDGTKKTTKSLCNTCSYSTIVEGDRTRERIVECSRIEVGPITFDVYNCNKYIPANLPSLSDMRQTAWMLEIDEKKRDYGFIPYKKWAEQKKETYPDTDDMKSPFDR